MVDIFWLFLLELETYSQDRCKKKLRVLINWIFLPIEKYIFGIIYLIRFKNKTKRQQCEQNWD